MKQLLFLGVLCTLLFTSCSSDDVMLLSQQGNEPTQSYRVSPEQAVTRAMSAVASLDGSRTRGATLTVKSVEARSVLTTLTRSNQADTLVYVINFEDDAGFAIVGADERMLPIYAVSDEGNLSVTEHQSDALSDILQGIEYDARARIILPTDSLIITKPFPDPNMYYKIRKGPHLTQRVSLISHGLYYSTYCRNSKGEPARTGCVAVATAQLMCFYKWPETYDGYTFDWNKMVNGQDDDGIARLIAYVGLPENLAMIYTSLNSIAGASHTYVPRTLRNFEYERSPVYRNFFYYEQRVQEILESEPIMMQAKSSKEDYGGHQWVIDGYLGYSLGGFDIGKPVIIKYLYHCVWGDNWEGVDGNCNGYYYVADTKSFIGAPDEFAPNDSGVTSGDEFHYHDLIIDFLDNVIPNRTNQLYPV